MSEHSALPGATSVAEPPAPLLPAGFDDGDSDNRRKLMIVGAIAGVVVLLIAAFFLLKGGSSSPTAASGLVPHGAPSAGGSAGTGGHGHKPITLPKAFHGNVGRDPFKPLYVQPVAATGGGTKTTGKTTGTTTGGGGNPTPAPGGGQTKPAKFAPVWIELVSVKGTKSASFVVGESNGKKTRNVAYNNIPVPKNSLRTTFGGVFALLSIQNGMATVQYGDAQPFDLAPGFGNRHFVG